jgi:hypothetical protein
MKKSIIGGLTIPSKSKNIQKVKLGELKQEIPKPQSLKIETPIPVAPKSEEPIFFDKIKEKINRIQDDKLRNKLEKYWKKTENREKETQTLKIEDNSTLTIVSRMV